MDRNKEIKNPERWNGFTAEELGGMEDGLTEQIAKQEALLAELRAHRKRYKR